jgi:hypothetical protein
MFDDIDGSCVILALLRLDVPLLYNSGRTRISPLRNNGFNPVPLLSERQQRILTAKRWDREFELQSRRDCACGRNLKVDLSLGCLLVFYFTAHFNNLQGQTRGGI